MPPREQGGGLSEASRLLQEGLLLLDERSREVDALVRNAEERAREVTADAEQRAQAITADAERQRTELEEQVAALRGEIAAVREELANLSVPAAVPVPVPQRGGRGGTKVVAAAVPLGVGQTASAESGPGSAGPQAAETSQASASEAAAGSASAAAAGTTGESASEAAAGTAGGSASEATAVLGADEIAAAAEAAAASEAAGTPRWGRRSTIAAAQQAIRSRSSRPRWLPPWIPFLLVLLAAAGVVTATVGGQTDAPPAGAPTPRAVILVTSAPTPSVLQVAAATSIATSIALAAGSLPQTAPSAPPTRLPTVTANSARPTSTAAGAAFATPTPRLNPTLQSTRQSIALPAPRAPLGAPVLLPDDASPEGPIVAAYTTYSTYTVQPGDTLNRVATEFGVSGDTIVQTSGLSDPNLLRPGQVLTIPRNSGWLYRVQPNDTIEVIALRFGISVDELLMESQLSSPSVRVGDLLFVPSRATPAPKQ